MTIHAGEDVERFEGEGRVARWSTKSGTRVEADAVVVGVGVTPDVMLAQRAGLEIGERGGVKTDSRLQTSAPDVYAAGDIAEYESVGPRRRPSGHPSTGTSPRTRAKTAALKHARQPAASPTVVPYFFSDLADWTWME